MAKKDGEIYSECLDDFFDLNVSLPNDYTEFKTDEKDIKLVIKLVEYDDCFELNVDLDDNFLIGNKHLYVVDYKNITRYTLDADGFFSFTCV